MSHLTESIKNQLAAVLPLVFLPDMYDRIAQDLFQMILGKLPVGFLAFKIRNDLHAERIHGIYIFIKRNFWILY